MTALFLLSARHRRALARWAVDGGWRAVTAERNDDAEACFIASGAPVALVDARSALEESKAAVRAIGKAAEAQGAALLVLVSRNDEGALADLHALGATHFLTNPVTKPRLIEALRYAMRYADRAGGGALRAARERRATWRRDDAPRAAINLLPDQASADRLTGLGDRRAMRDWLAGRLAVQGGNSVILLLLSVSRYDAINAAFGRSIGDVVLQEAALRIAQRARAAGEDAMVARMSGAEFAVALPAPASIADGRTLGERIIEAIARPFMVGDHVVSLGGRAGVVASRPGDDAVAVLRRASLALAGARGTDSAPLRVLDESGEKAKALESRLEVDLRRALARGEVEVRFQPQVEIGSGRIVGAEALVRWQHPDRGEIGAETLIAAAGRSDYLAILSEHVQRRALAAAASWPEPLAPLRLSVNITAADLVRPGFPEQFLKLVRDSGLAPERVTVEITESGLIDDLPNAAALLAKLRAGGLRVAIDDFGTGYSSLAYLKSLPLDYLKIDARLSQDISGSARDRAVVRSVIEMARSLGFDVIAEGVETEEQLEILAEEGCTLYQGFLCAPPLDADGLAALIDRESSPGPCSAAARR